MAKEKELYRDTLERIRERADEFFPNKLLYNQKEAAQLMGCSPAYLRGYGITGLITCEQLAKVFS